MTVDVADAIEDGLDRTVTRQGGILVAVLAGLSVGATLVQESFARRLSLTLLAWDEFVAEAPAEVIAETRRETLARWPDQYVDLPLETLLAAIVAIWLLQTVVRIGAIRWFVAGDADAPLRPELFTRRILWTIGNLIVGFVLYGLAVTVGLILLVVPGVFLAVALFFYNYEIVVEGENAIDALANSYELTSGNRVELFVLGVVFAVVSSVVAVLTGLVVAGTPLLTAAGTAVVGGAIGVVGIGIAAAAYNQLRGSAGEETVGAVGPDEL